MSDTQHRVEFVADRGDAHLRLDQILTRRVTDVSRLSRTLAQRWIAAGAVTVDAVVATRGSSHVREGAAIGVDLPSDTVMRERPEAEPGDLTVLYEDEWLLAVDKPPGIVVHPSYKQHHGTLLNRVLWHLPRGNDAVPGILTRLDKDTSGIVVVALSPAVHARLQRDAAAGRVMKDYLAIVRGQPTPAHGRITQPLARDPDDRRRVVVAAAGAPSDTLYDTLATGADVSLLRCALVTGRTHQIRVHLAWSGWPVVGDRTYGTADTRIGRQALHAWRIELPHPHTGNPLRLEAPLPDDMGHLRAAGGLV